ncbi:MAG: helix-turn-helix transcriptional regulator [Planctomycetota bacterium]|nr:helix-turn-helix transcriptional regulator [Planctomycetota bacterium]
MTKFSIRLRRLMDEQGATIRSVSAHSGLRQDDIYGYLQTQTVPKKEAARKIARALGASLNDLMPPAPPKRVVEVAGEVGAGRRRPPPRQHAGTPGEGKAATAPTEEGPIERTERRQRAIIYLLAHRGIFSKLEWERKLAEVSVKRPGT